MRHRVCILALLLAVVATPWASASDQWQAELQASSIHVGPSSRMEAPLVFFVSESTLTSDALPDPAFHLEAEHATVEVDYSEATIWSGTTYHGVAGNTTKTSFDHVQAQGLSNRAGHRILIIPEVSGATVDVESQCGEVDAPNEDAADRNPRAASTADRPPVEIDSSNAIQWTDCGTHATLSAKGDFVVALWEWDFQATGDQGIREFETGRLTHPSLQDAPLDTSGTVSRDQEAWIFVDNGTFTFELDRGVPHVLYASPAGTIATETGFLLHDATGTIPLNDGFEASGQEVFLQGDLDAAMERLPEGGLRTQIQGDVTGFRVNDETLWAEDASVAAGDPTAPWLIITAAVLLLLVAFLAAPQVYYHILAAGQARRIQGLPNASRRQRQSSALTVMARNASNRRHPRRAIVLARLAAWSHEHPQSHIEQTRAYAQLGRLQRVHESHRRLDHLLRGDARERCRNAWHAFQALHETHSRLALLWYKRANAYHPQEFAALSKTYPIVPALPNPGPRLAPGPASA